MTRAAIYARISSDRDDERLGVDRQVTDCRKLCRERGWGVAGEYVDNSIGAADPRKVRPEYQRLLADIRYAHAPREGWMGSRHLNSYIEANVTAVIEMADGAAVGRQPDGWWS